MIKIDTTDADSTDFNDPLGDLSIAAERAIITIGDAIANTLSQGYDTVLQSTENACFPIETSCITNNDDDGNDDGGALLPSGRFTILTEDEDTSESTKTDDALPRPSQQEQQLQPVKKYSQEELKNDYYETRVMNEMMKARESKENTLEEHLAGFYPEKKDEKGSKKKKLIPRLKLFNR
mmetsp:Transcript_1122/g.2457  ORF Transcript_1122/g.2457 Transcript_1122/m.2457 type:complete len:179 (+) Transcript_1122:130-666(+)